MIINQVLHRFRIWISYVALVLTGFVCFAFFRFPLNFMRVRGKDHIPKRGKKVLFVSNHLTMYDSFLIAVAAFFPSILTRPSRPPVNFAAEENFFTRCYVKILLKLLKTVPVKKGRNDPFLMRKYAEFLEKRNILIFYQGTRSFNLKQIKFGPGYVIANSEEKLTVIPVYHEGITRIFSRGGPKTRGLWRWLPRSLFHRTTVSFGPPITFEDLMGIENQRERIEAINERIIYRIEELQAASAAPTVEGSG
jgi:1-acyl-sn-glycerol-3-phosphate acyltransferase